MTKEEFFKDIDEIKRDKLFVTDSLDNVDEEIRNNCWPISMSEKIASECTVDELKSFLKDVKSGRVEQLSKVKSKLQLIYYLWIDTQAGQLRFNFINSKHSNLPFSSPLIFVELEDDILSDYLSRRETDIETVRVYKELISA